MADINLEKKRSSSAWLWVVVALLVVVVLAWWMWPDEELEPVVAEAPMTEVQPPTAPLPEPVAQMPGIPVSQIVESPTTWTGRTVEGEVRVTSVPTDRGFWIEDQGEQLFVLINPEGGEAPNIQPNTTVRIEEGTVRDTTFVAGIPGEISDETRNILQDQSVFIVTDPGNIRTNVQVTQR